MRTINGHAMGASGEGAVSGDCEEVEVGQMAVNSSDGGRGNEFYRKLWLKRHGGNIESCACGPVECVTKIFSSGTIAGQRCRRRRRYRLGTKGGSATSCVGRKES